LYELKAGAQCFVVEDDFINNTHSGWFGAVRNNTVGFEFFSDNSPNLFAFKTVTIPANIKVIFTNVRWKNTSANDATANAKIFFRIGGTTYLTIDTKSFDTDEPSVVASNGASVNIANLPAGILAGAGNWSTDLRTIELTIPNAAITDAQLILNFQGGTHLTLVDDFAFEKFTVVGTASTANAGADVTIGCSDTSGKMIGVASVSGWIYSWSPSTGLSSTTISNPTANPLATTTYTLTVSNIEGCTSTDQVKVTVDKTLPTANAGADLTIGCFDTSGKMIGSASVAGMSYSWSPSAGLSSTTIANPTANPSATTTYKVMVTNTATGCSSTDEVIVKVNTTTPTANAGADFTKTCTSNASGKEIGSASVAGMSYSWSPADGLSSATVSNPIANPTETKTYTLTVTNDVTGCTSTDEVTVTVNTTSPTANAGTDFTKTCTSNASGKEIGSASVAGMSYSWSPADGLSSATVSNPIANPTVTTTYTLTVTNDASGCTSTDAVLVSVANDMVIADAGADFTKTCTSNTSGLQIGTTAVSGVTYSWSPAIGLSSITVSNPTANPTVTTTYTLMATNPATGCTSTDEVIVTVNTTAPTANAGADFTKTCTSNASGKEIGMASVAGMSYSWSPIGGLSSATVSNPNANPTATTTYTLTVTNDATGCTSTDEVTVTVDSESEAGCFNMNCTVNSYSIIANTEVEIDIIVPYTGGIAISYPEGPSINLMNGTLRARLQAGTINPAGGNLVYRLTGKAATSNKLILPVNFAGKSCDITILVVEPNLTSLNFSVLAFNDKNNDCVRSATESSAGLPTRGLFIKVFNLSNNLLYKKEISSGQFDVENFNGSSDLIYYYIIDTNDLGSDTDPSLPTGWGTAMAAPALKRYFHFDGSLYKFNTSAVLNLSDSSWDASTPFQVCLNQTAGLISTLDCNNAVFSGVLTRGISTSASFTINYTGGNGGFYDAQTLSSTGVNGLRASLTAGSFADGAGTLSFKLSGIPISGGSGKFSLVIGGITCEIKFIVEIPLLSYTDLDVTNINVPVSGNTSTNDVAPVGTTYGSPVPNSANPIGGNITINPNGSYTFIGSSAGVYRYLVPVCAPLQTSGCEEIELQITVLDAYINTNPPVVNPDIAIVKEDSSIEIAVLNNDKSSNTGIGLDLSTLKITEQPQNATVRVNSDGKLIFTPNAAFVGTDIFTYSVCDDANTALCQTAMVEVTVISKVLNDETIASDDLAIMKADAEGKASVIGNVLSNDYSTNSSANLSVSLVSSAITEGTLILNSNGSYKFTPKAGFVGPLDIIYLVCDDATPSNCAKATLHILVEPTVVDLKISKIATSSNWFEGNEFDYVIKISNNSFNTANNVIVIDDLPESLQYISTTFINGSGFTNVSGQLISWTINSLAPGAFVELRVRVKALPLTSDVAINVVNRVAVTSNQIDLNPLDNISSARVQINPFFIPNTITPNSDGLNDTFEIPGLGRFVSNELVIVNRWSDHVFQTYDYQNQWSADGLPSGTYFYVLKTLDSKGQSYEFKGFIQVVKESLR
jgi:gliding motility-associated-like protein/uncharacterized repeat protein (TIGR01451 family)